MITRNKVFFEDLLSQINYNKYFNEIIDNQLLDKVIENPGASIQYEEGASRNRTEPIPAELGDLARIMHIIKSLKIATILEFGSGKSTVCSSFALQKNKAKYANFVSANLRTHQAWKLFSVETSEKWLSVTKSKLTPDLLDIVEFHLSSVIMERVTGRLCTLYKDLPNCRPDLIYIDGPSQYDPINSINGISTNHEDRMPMSGDILTIEYFLEPGCIIVVDGRTANARFLRNNFQRNWHYEYIEDFDQHFFLLNEPPLGKFNREGINFRFEQN